MLVLGVHIALHWKWIVGIFKKIKFKTDIHNLSELKAVISKSFRQILFLVVISVVLSLLFWLFEYSEWAEGFRAGSAEGEAPKEMPNSWLTYILPLVKVTVLMTIPALITGGVLRLKKRVSK